MKTETTAELLERVARENANGGWSYMAKAQAAALAKAAEGTIAISAEGLPDRKWFLRLAGYQSDKGVRTALTRVAEALPEPVPPLPTAPWSVVTEPDGDAWVLGEDGMWRFGSAERAPRDLVNWHGPLTVRHDAGAGR